MLALLLMAVTGAWAQEPATYKITVAEGTEDAENWSVPKEAAEGSPVTVTYSGEKKVKSVKAVKKEVAPKPDLLPAVFTVDAGKTVKFSKGNLQATYNGSSWIWGFAEHQWDYIGNAAGNTSINGNGTVSANGTVDLFGWVGASSTWTGAAQYGISNSTATNNVDGYGNVGSEAQKVGWGATVGTGWRTLTRLEWLYLLSTRETGITVNSTNHARYTLATINTDGTAVKGLIIFPDSYAGGSPAGVTWGTINAKSTFETTCTSAGWTALEAAGCVFLPAAGYREASNITDAGIGGGYWSSSSGYAASAFGLYFESDYMTIQYGGSRKYGFSVRLVQANNPYANAKLGDLFYSDGTFSSTLVAGKTPIGVIAYLDQEGTDDDEICEKSNGAGHGLVMCLKNAAASTIAWSTESVSKFSGQEVTSVDGLKRTTNVSGYTNTATLTADAETAAKYPAAKAAKEYTTLAAPTGTTGWFLPSAQQWVKMQTGLGALKESSITWNSWFDNNHEGADKWEAALSKAGSGNYDSMTSANLYNLYYWSSSENSASYAVSLNVCAMVDYGFNWYYDEKNPKGSSFRVRPVLAF